MDNINMKRENIKNFLKTNDFGNDPLCEEIKELLDENKRLREALIPSPENKEAYLPLSQKTHIDLICSCAEIAPYEGELALTWETILAVLKRVRKQAGIQRKD